MGEFQGNWNKTTYNELNRLRIPTDRKQTSWLCTRAGDELNKTNLDKSSCMMKLNSDCQMMDDHDDWQDMQNDESRSIVILMIQKYIKNIT